MIKRLGVIALVMSASMVALSACGGDSDEDEVRETVQLLIDSDREVCGKMTDKLLEEIFSSKGECEQEAEDESSSEEAEIKSVEIDGDEAKVRVDPEEGASGTVTLVREDDAWLVSSIVED